MKSMVLYFFGDFNDMAALCKIIEKMPQLEELSICKNEDVDRRFESFDGFDVSKVRQIVLPKLKNC
jgi:hypothetical protein